MAFAGAGSLGGPEMTLLLQTFPISAKTPQYDTNGPGKNKPHEETKAGTKKRNFSHSFHFRASHSESGWDARLKRHTLPTKVGE